MTESFKLPADIDDHVVAQLLGQSWEQLEILEVKGYLMFPDVICRMLPDKTYEQKKIYLRIPRMPEMRQARVMARKIAEDDGLNPLADRDMIEDLETVCILTMAIRNDTDPFEPWVEDPKELEKYWDKSSLAQLWHKLDAIMVKVDPRPQTIGKEEMLMLISKISKERHLGPLAVYGSDAQAFFVTFMADLALSYLASKSSSDPSEPSMRA